MNIHLNTVQLALCLALGLNAAIWLALGLVGFHRGNIPAARVVAMVLLSPVLTARMIGGVLSDLLWRIQHEIRLIAQEARYLLGR